MVTLKKAKKYRVLGVDISPYSQEEFFQLVASHLQNGESSQPLFVVTVNPEIAVESIVDNEFKNILTSSSINTADGIGIRWAINFLYDKHIERITGSDSLEKICRISARCNKSVFLYGAMPTVADQAATVLKQRINQLDVEGTFSPDSTDVEFEQLPAQTQQQLREASVIFVALGAPAQEKWIRNNLSELANCKLIIGVGGTFDFIAGKVKRAPKWMQDLGLEWFYRLITQPRRWRRMLKFPVFVLNILFLKYTK